MALVLDCQIQLGTTVKVIGAMNDKNYHSYILQMGEYGKVVAVLDDNHFLVLFKEGGKTIKMNGRALVGLDVPFISKPRMFNMMRNSEVYASDQKFWIDSFSKIIKVNNTNEMIMLLSEGFKVTSEIDIEKFEELFGK